LPNLDIKLVDDAGKDISGFDVRGELCIRGPTVIRGYLENEEANKRDFDDEGYFHTGDIAYVARVSELWYIVDRKKVSSPCVSARRVSEVSLTACFRN
jgi:4-coumarate--CoA ligase